METEVAEALEPLDIVDDRTPFAKWCDRDGPPAMPSKVYVASSWRNMLQPAIVGALRSAGIDVYDFKNPAPGNNGFSWREIHPNWQSWSPAEWRSALAHPVAQHGYRLDKEGMDSSECCVLVLPCGRSAHLEAGYMAGQGKRVFTLVLEKCEPELMSLLLGPNWHICTNMDELLENLGVPN